MPSRDLPARPNLDHLKHEAKALRDAYDRADPDAVARVHATLGLTSRTIKLAQAQRALAREYGFPTWARLRAHVQASRGVPDAVRAFLDAAMNRDRAAALEVLARVPEIAITSLHVAAVLGRTDDVRRIAAREPAQVHARAGEPSGEPLLWLCHSPFHGESPERDFGLLASARALLDAGADPNTKDGHYGVPALYAVTGFNNAPRVARLLLEAGAEPNDGESVFHAAERFHEEALELLMEYGVDLNYTGDWGNTALHFLLRYHDLAREPSVRRGVEWLLAHGADPNVVSGRERETSLHVAVRRGQLPEIVRLLLDHGADVNASRGDGPSPWVLARRAGHGEIAALLESHGARTETLSDADRLMEACGRGDAAAARSLATPPLVASLGGDDLRLLVDAAERGRSAVVSACLAAGFPVGTTDQGGATALHHAAIHGRLGIVRELLASGADFRLRDGQHRSTPLGWAQFGADVVADPGGDYEGTVSALLDAGAVPTPDEYRASHAGVRAVLARRFPESGVG